MPTETLSLSTDDMEYALGVCRDNARDPDFRFSLDDVTPQLGVGATHYAMRYSGTFSFMVDMRIQARRRSLTLPQAKGVLNCMLAEVRRQRAASVPPVVVDMSAIMTLFRRAGTRLQRPRVTLSGVTLKLGTRGQFPGTIGLTSGQWPNSVWLGRIGVDGTLTRGRNMTDDVLTLIQELAADPVAAAQRYASLTGNCCFCNLRLTDERSTQAGYGPVCAEHYGLPWGPRSAYDQAVRDVQRRGPGASVAEIAVAAREQVEPIFHAPYVQTPEGFTYQPGWLARRRRTPQVPALPGMTPLGMQAEAMIDRTVEDINAAVRDAGYEVHQFGRTIHMCGECPAFAICQEQGQCNGGVVA